jgi:hypothetical protein
MKTVKDMMIKYGMSINANGLYDPGNDIFCEDDFIVRCYPVKKKLCKNCDEKTNCYSKED